MVKDEFTEIYEGLKKRDELYKKATRKSDSIITLGVLIFLFSIPPVIPVFLYAALNISIRISWPISFLLGMSLIIIGQKVKNRKIKPPELLATERQFLKVYEALENLDTYLENGNDFSRMEAIKILRKIEKNLKQPDLSSYEFWNELMKDYKENLSLFKRNLRERLFPAINKGEQEPIKLAYSVTEDFAEFLLNPNYNELINLNISISNLDPEVTEKKPKIQLIQKMPIIKHIIIISFFGLLSFSAYYLGPKYLQISPDTSYTTAVMMFVTLAVGYMNFIRTRA